MMYIKRVLVVLATTTLSQCLFAQTNVFPGTGSVGVNTTSPLSIFHVNGVMRWGGYSSDYSLSGEDGLGLYIEQVGSSAGKSKIRLQSSVNGDQTNYSQFFVDPHNGFCFLGQGTGSSNVGIGTSNTRGYRLAVAGGILAEKVKVQPISAWPDYVFEPDYDLMPIDSVGQFIRNNKHLPGVPSAATVAADGVDLGEMNRRLLEKVEEMTLYMLDMQQRLKALESKTK